MISSTIDSHAIFRGYISYCTRPSCRSKKEHGAIYQALLEQVPINEYSMAYIHGRFSRNGISLNWSDIRILFAQSTTSLCSSFFTYVPLEGQAHSVRVWTRFNALWFKLRNLRHWTRNCNWLRRVEDFDSRILVALIRGSFVWRQSAHEHSPGRTWVGMLVYNNRGSIQCALFQKYKVNGARSSGGKVVDVPLEQTSEQFIALAFTFWCKKSSHNEILIFLLLNLQTSCVMDCTRNCVVQCCAYWYCWVGATHKLQLAIAAHARCLATLPQGRMFFNWKQIQRWTSVILSNIITLLAI